MSDWITFDPRIDVKITHPLVQYRDGEWVKIGSESLADFNIIGQGVATGAAIGGPADVADLIKAGVTHIIDCRAEYDDQMLLATSGLGYLWNPTADDGQPKPDSWWGTGISWAAHVFKTVPAALIDCHCAAGVNRGPSLAMGLLRAIRGFSAADAEAMIRKARPQVGLAYKADFERWFVSPAGIAVRGSI